MGHFGAVPLPFQSRIDGPMPYFVRPLCRGFRRDGLISLRLFAPSLVTERSRNIRLSRNGAFFLQRLAWVVVALREASANRRYAAA